MFSTLFNFISSYKSNHLLVTGCHVYIHVSGRQCNIVLNVHVPREDDDSNDSVYEELQ